MKAGDRIKITTESSGRRGELAEVVHVGIGLYPIVAEHPDGERRAWRRDEVEAVRP